MEMESERRKIKTRVDFKGGAYFVFLEAESLSAIGSQEETCGTCGKEADDPQNAIRIFEVSAVYGDDGSPLEGHPHFTQCIFGPGVDYPLPVGVEIDKRLKGKIICQKCRDALATPGITLSE